jgi:hypothetical protein
MCASQKVRTLSVIKETDVMCSNYFSFRSDSNFILKFALLGKTKHEKDFFFDKSWYQYLVFQKCFTIVIEIVMFTIVIEIVMFTLMSI